MSIGVPRRSLCCQRCVRHDGTTGFGKSRRNPDAFAAGSEVRLAYRAVSLTGLTSMDVPARDKAEQLSITVVFTTEHDAEAITFSLRRCRAKRRLQAPETYNLDQVLAEVRG